MVGRPDFQSVPRIFAARVVFNAGVAVVAGTRTVTSFTGGALDEVAVISIELPASMALEVLTFDHLQVNINQRKIVTGTIPSTQEIHMPLRLLGGPVDISLRNGDAVNHTPGLIVISYIGAKAQDIVAPNANQDQFQAGVAAGANIVQTTTFRSGWETGIRWVAHSTQAYEVRMNWSWLGNDNVLRQQTEVLAVGAAGAVTRGDTPIAAPGYNLYLNNTAGVAANMMLTRNPYSSV